MFTECWVTGITETWNQLRHTEYFMRGINKSLAQIQKKKRKKETWQNLYKIHNTLHTHKHDIHKKYQQHYKHRYKPHNGTNKDTYSTLNTHHIGTNKDIHSTLNTHTHTTMVQIKTQRAKPRFIGQATRQQIHCPRWCIDTRVPNRSLVKYFCSRINSFKS